MLTGSRDALRVRREMKASGLRSTQGRRETKKRKRDENATTPSRRSERLGLEVEIKPLAERKSDLYKRKMRREICRRSEGKGCDSDETISRYLYRGMNTRLRKAKEALPSHELGLMRQGHVHGASPDKHEASSAAMTNPLCRCGGERPGRTTSVWNHSDMVSELPHVVGGRRTRRPSGGFRGGICFITSCWPCTSYTECVEVGQHVQEMWAHEQGQGKA